MSIIAGNSHSFKSDSIFKYLAKAYQSLDATQKDRLLSQVKVISIQRCKSWLFMFFMIFFWLQVSGVFEFHIQNGERKTEIFTVDLKQDGLITKGVVKKPDVIIYISDGDFVDFSRGRLNGMPLVYEKKM